MVPFLLFQQIMEKLLLKISYGTTLEVEKGKMSAATAHPADPDVTSLALFTLRHVHLVIFTFPILINARILSRERIGVEGLYNAAALRRVCELACSDLEGLPRTLSSLTVQTLLQRAPNWALTVCLTIPARARHWPPLMCVTFPRTQRYSDRPRARVYTIYDA
jgi:hypothetical protein